MNELDSELVKGQLESLGYRLVDRDAGADVVLYNTCSVREQAESKAWSRIGVIRTASVPGRRSSSGFWGAWPSRMAMTCCGGIGKST